MKDKKQIPLKDQSAFEYLTTYAWTILIIAIVVGALYYIGAFNGSLFAPRAPPGSCLVSRANGAGTISFINIEGLCDGELPKFVSHFGYGGPFMEYGNSNITIPFIKFEPQITNNNNQKITITGWMMPYTEGNTETAFFYGDPAGVGGRPPYNGIYMNLNESGYCNSGLFMVLYTSNVCIANSILQNNWLFVAIEYNGTHAVAYAINSTMTIQANGVVSSFAIPAHSQLLISTPWNGLLSNIQMYNTSLTYNQVYSQYKAGLGGAPINLQHLVGWWPLNGNTNDYSGNGNNGYPVNSAFYSGTWSNNYLQP